MKEFSVKLLIFTLITLSFTLSHAGRIDNYYRGLAFENNGIQSKDKVNPLLKEVYRKNEAISSLTLKIRDELLFLQGAKQTLENTSAGGDVAFGLGLFGLLSDALLIERAGTVKDVSHRGVHYSSISFGRRGLFRFAYIIAFVVAMFNTDKDEVAKIGDRTINKVSYSAFPTIDMSDVDFSLSDIKVEEQLTKKSKEADAVIGEAAKVLSELKRISEKICECKRP